jgi:hypothetical protein
MDTATVPEVVAPVPPTEEWRSIHDDSLCEAEKYKWIESEKAGHDVGENAIRRWVRDHWWGYLRARWLQHLHGKCFWVELDRNDYGLLQRAFVEEKELLNSIVDRLKCGQENLDIIIWAISSGQSLRNVLHILEVLDMNGRRLVCRFESRN